MQPCSFSSFVHSLVLLALLVACEQPTADAAPAGEPPATEVATVVVATEAVPRVRELPGRVASSRVAEVRARVSGIVLERVFEEGSYVKKGDVLFRLEPTVYRAERDAQTAALVRAEATRDQALRHANRTQTLLERQTVSTAQHDVADAALKQAEADVASARARLARARVDLDHATVRAPISGRIGRALVTEGALVNEIAATHLATIHQIDPIYVDFVQPVDDLDPSERDGAAKVELVRADGSVYGEVGQLLFTDVSVDPGTAQVTTRASFPNPDGALLPGTYVRVRLARGRDVEAIVVPPQAIQRSSAGEAQAFVVDDAGKIALRPLRTGPLTARGWIVEEGLSAGETVVVEGFQKIRPGASVTPMPWAPPSPASATAQR
ncbi:membrane fusion protein, multidrug efflux system [Nannocystis exedens]|uniref:Membrane fusion protein, multidrug efflux system n=1 Tax=Nannocystis exedens TaxID=54 RepID=A0A1I1V5Q8_9BACT|nr:efflux RND transporter periplasmic adaptor subunit [Nannocystis exedens]PCC72368.1 MexE family multidrug efflux RND transporter periplasmic adaptor subunit [Nannocystis exedens]SFD78357.1 membrane fusion protein, multidrug efflux system [Nannocystis exedens]